MEDGPGCGHGMNPGSRSCSIRPLISVREQHDFEPLLRRSAAGLLV